MVGEVKLSQFSQPEMVQRWSDLESTRAPGQQLERPRSLYSGALFTSEARALII
jgi:hypothetical protein